MSGDQAANEGERLNYVMRIHRDRRAQERMTDVLRRVLDHLDAKDFTINGNIEVTPYEWPEDNPRPGPPPELYDLYLVQVSVEGLDEGMADLLHETPDD